MLLSTVPFLVPRVSAAIGMDRFFGSLTIDCGSIVFAPTSKLNRVLSVNEPQRLVHTTRHVIIVRARLLPPNLNSALILQGNGRLGEPLSAGVQMAAWTRRRLRPVLLSSGFDLDERLTWLSLGGGGSTSELPRPRP
jgi:hypothetical protein